MPDNVIAPVWLVGAGAIGAAHAQVLAHMGLEATVIGRGATTAAAFSAKTGMAVRMGGLADWLRSKPQPPAAVVLAVDIEELAAAAIALMEYGARRILVEKPGGVDGEEIEAVARCSARTGSQVFVGYNRRFLASSMQARDLINSDGGASSFSFEFTELAARIGESSHSARVKENWFLANSTHVVDLAYFLGGRPQSLHSQIDGRIDWHAPARFSGCGRSVSGALFHYGADWTSAGRWGVEINTKSRRMILRPLETLQMQQNGNFEIHPFVLDDEADKTFKPGFLRQMQAFLAGHRATDLQDIETQAEMVGGVYAAMLRGKTIGAGER